jgi:hypothetical protein
MRIGATTLPMKPIASVLRSTQDSSLGPTPQLLGNEVGHVLVFEEMVVPFNIKLEPQALADKGNGYAGASPAEFSIAREVDAQYGVTSHCACAGATVHAVSVSVRRMQR